jgi:hypothetical protein
MRTFIIHKPLERNCFWMNVYCIQERRPNLWYRRKLRTLIRGRGYGRCLMEMIVLEWKGINLGAILDTRKDWHVQIWTWFLHFLLSFYHIFIYGSWWPTSCTLDKTIVGQVGSYLNNLQKFVMSSSCREHKIWM